MGRAERVVVESGIVCLFWMTRSRYAIRRGQKEGRWGFLSFLLSVVGTAGYDERRRRDMYVERGRLREANDDVQCIRPRRLTRGRRRRSQNSKEEERRERAKGNTHTHRHTHCLACLCRAARRAPSSLLALLRRPARASHFIPFRHATPRTRKTHTPDLHTRNNKIVSSTIPNIKDIRPAIAMSAQLYILHTT